MRHPQLNEHGELKHLLTIEGLPRSVVTHILLSSFVEVVRVGWVNFNLEANVGLELDLAHGARSSCPWGGRLFSKNI